MTCELCKYDYCSLYPMLVCILSQHIIFFLTKKKKKKSKKDLKRKDAENLLPPALNSFDLYIYMYVCWTHVVPDLSVIVAGCLCSAH